MGVTVALQPVERSGRDKRLPEPCIFVVFGASGDLTKRKLLPALFHLRQVGLLPEEFAVVGVARRDLSETFVPEMKDGIVKGGGVAQTRCTRHGAVGRRGGPMGPGRNRETLWNGSSIGQEAK